MFTRATAICLMVAILSANFARLFVYAGFELNKQYIAAELCENINKPWLHCNGHCYFMKKVEQARENEKKQATRDNFTKTSVSFFNQPSSITFIEPALLTSNKAVSSIYTFQYNSTYINTPFIPPKTVA